MRTRWLLTTAAAALVCGVGVGADLKSGPQPGDKMPVFHPLYATGPSAGKTQCPV